MKNDSFYFVSSNRLEYVVLRAIAISLTIISGKKIKKKKSKEF